MRVKPLVLIILDGWGHRTDKTNNGIELASKPFFDGLLKKYPNTLIDGSGKAVGLPEGIMGNSEVGHMNLGAGRIVFSGLSQIYQAIEDRSFFANPALLSAVTHVKKTQGTLHLLGLLSDGAVHSHQDHLYALLKLARDNKIKDVAIHCFMDGRDTAPTDGITYIKKLETKISELGVGRIASVSGRFYAMDRDKRWERVERAFTAVCGRGDAVSDAGEYLQSCYARDVGDEFIEPVCVADSSGRVQGVSEKDAMIFFNFRADRAREIAHAFVDKVFTAFPRPNKNVPGVFVCLAPYEKSINAAVAFTPEYPQNIFPEILSQHKLTQLRLAETEKYAHVTFFFNGGRDVVFDGEDRVLVPSPKEVKTYDLKPEMSALKVKDELINAVNLKKHDVIIVNFANTDMVGHTAVPAAILKAVACVDACLKEIVPVVLAAGGELLITADHGNAEEMVDKNGAPMTAHTINLVPFILVSEKNKSAKLKSGGRLCDVAPTMLALLGIDKPAVMTGESLIS